MPSNPFWLGSGGCPFAILKATVQYGVAQKCGFPEFDTGSGPSTPPKSYRHYAMSGSGWVYTIASVMTCTYAPTATSYGFNASTGDLENTGDTDTHVTFPSSAVDRRLQNSLFLDIFTAPPAGVTDGAGYSLSSDCGPFDPVIHLNSKTNLTLDMAGGSASGGRAVTAGSLGFTLTDEDTDDEAVARLLNQTGTGGGATVLTEDEIMSGGADTPADWFAAGIFSLQESRAGAPGSGYEWQLGVRTASIILTAKNVAPGVLYHAVIQIEERTAAGDGTGDESAYGSTWSAISPVSFDFRPDAPVFDCDSFDLPLASGQQRRIKSVTLTPIEG